MNERNALISHLRSEVVGPSQSLRGRTLVEVKDDLFIDLTPFENRQLFWKDAEGCEQEILYYERESPHRKYGTGLLYPIGGDSQSDDDAASKTADTVGVDIAPSDNEDSTTTTPLGVVATSGSDDSDEIDLSNSDVRMPSSLGISLFVSLSEDGVILLSMPKSRIFEWRF